MHECFPWPEGCESIFKDKNSPKIINFSKSFKKFSREIFKKFFKNLKKFKKYSRNFQEIHNSYKINMQVFFKIYRENIKIKLKYLRYFRKFQIILKKTF